ncbi:cytochrome c nitrite reductase small subunit [Maioricimonas rarisocia]|nr:cytochrome c nitrite reductase small subunit [Maioricimonas rarisocia]
MSPPQDPPHADAVSADAVPTDRRSWTWGSITWIVIGVMVGVMCGLGTFTFGYGQGASYLSNDPNSCANCHVMQNHLNDWQKSSHRHVAVCNDCHLPHDPIGKWVVKGDNGFFHSLAFTFENFHEPIQIKPRNRRVTQYACMHCHQDFIHQTLPSDSEVEMLACIHCHRDVGHAGR